MTIGSLLVSLTATTLGLAAFSPHAAEAGDFPPLSFRISPAKPKNDIVVAQASGDPAPASAESTGTTSPPPKTSCLTKEYLATGAVLFKDICTRQWAINSTAVATHKPVGRTCLSKEVSDDRIVIFQRHLHQRMGNEQRGPPHRSPAVGLTAASLHGVSAMGRRLQLVRPRPD
jgi:hypothetical protein